MNSRAKGKRGELEIVHMINDNLDLNVNRNYKQTAEAGHGDIEQLVGPYLIEVKNYASGAKVKSWWQQALTASAKRAGSIPCVAYKLPKKGWRFIVPIPLAWGSDQQWGREFQYTMDLSPDGFYLIVRDWYR